MGEVAEAYTVWSLSRAAIAYFDSHGSVLEVEKHRTTRKRELIVIRGTVRNEEEQVTIKNVGTARLGCDIHVAGAVLSDTGIGLSRVDSTTESTVEVKGTKSTNGRSFTLTKREHEYAAKAGDSHYFVRLRSVDPEIIGEPGASTAAVECLWHGVESIEKDAEITPSTYEVRY